MNKFNLILKRLFDVIFSIIGMIIALPVLITIALLIKITSKGSVFFKQKRLGKNGKEFYIIKFRTMVVNAEEIGDGLTVKDNNDNRITRIGKILRKSSLDELPQLLNVIKGDMSLVGPRPPVTYFPYDGFESYPNWTKQRFEMLPGVTGLAQITVRNSVVWDERIKIDIKYIESFNFWLDIKIIFKTFLKIFKSEDIYMSKKSTESKSS